MNSNTFKFSLIKTSPIMISYFFISMGLGIVLEQSGWNWLWGLSTSLFIYTGAFQFVLANFLATGASLLTVILTALFMNSRQIFYGVSFLDSFKKTGKYYPYMIHSLTDETYALYTSLNYPQDVDKDKSMVLIAVFAHVSWIAGTLIGGLIGKVIPVTLNGIDFALTALFITIVIDQIRDKKNRKSIITGFVCSAFFLLILGADLFLLPSFFVTSGLIVMEVLHANK